MNITMVCAAILAILFFTLSFRTIKLRRSLKIGLGDGGNPILLRAIRAHSNFSEYVPISILLLYFVELKSENSILIYVLVSVLLIGRFSHAYGFSQQKENFKFRVFGMACTFTVILVSAVYLLFKNLFI